MIIAEVLFQAFCQPIYDNERCPLSGGKHADSPSPIKSSTNVYSMAAVPKHAQSFKPYEPSLHRKFKTHVLIQSKLAKVVGINPGQAESQTQWFPSLLLQAVLASPTFKRIPLTITIAPPQQKPFLSGALYRKASTTHREIRSHFF